MNKPKFKVGDTVVYKDKLYKVLDVYPSRLIGGEYEYDFESLSNDIVVVYKHVYEEELSSSRSGSL